MKNAAELLTVVVSADQFTTALLVILTVPLPLHTGPGSCATFSLIHISPLTSSWQVHYVVELFCWFDTAIIFWMENISKLFAVVVSADKLTSALLVSLAVPLPLHTGPGGGAALALVHIPPLTSRPWAREDILRRRLDAAVILGVEHRPELLTVVVPAHQAAPALAAVVTVALTLLSSMKVFKRCQVIVSPPCHLARLAGGAAAAGVHIPAPAPGPPGGHTPGPAAHHRHGDVPRGLQGSAEKRENGS